MKVSKENKVENDKWRAEDDLRALISVEEIKNDDKRMAAVKKLAKEKIADMKKIGKEKAEEKDEIGETEKDEIGETVGM